MPSIYAFLALWLALPLAWLAIVFIGYRLGVRRG